MEKQKIIQNESETMEKKETLSSSIALTGDLNLSDDIGVNFQSNITTDFAQAFSEQYQAITDASKNDEQHSIDRKNCFCILQIKNKHLFIVLFFFF